MEEFVHILLSVFIYPIEAFLEYILLFFYSIVNNYGIAIILISLSINTLLLPFVYLAEHFQEKHRKKMEWLEPDMKIIKECYSKRERHIYVKALYRIHKYSPFSAIQPLCGLFIQVPFFIAAFLFLRDYAPMQGVGFLAIADLAKPDQLLWGVNLLPVMMTLINFLAIYNSRNKNSSSDTYKLTAIAVLFLVILYQESSAMLIYWTTSNVYSLVKQTIDSRFNSNPIKNFSIYITLNTTRKIVLNAQVRRFFSDAFIQSGVFIAGAIFVYNAIPMAASDVDMYTAPYFQVVGTLLVFFAFSVMGVVFLRKILPAYLLPFASAAMAFGAMVTMFYGFLFPYDIGQLQSLNIPVFPIKYINETMRYLFLLLFVFIVFLFIYRKLDKKIIFVISFANIFLFLTAFVHGVSPVSRGSKSFDGVDYVQSIELKEKITDAYTFSIQSNVIVIVLDMFQNGIFADIIHESPHLKNTFDGFTYFPNTLSVGKTTRLSTPSIAGGPEFSVQNLSGKKSTTDLMYEGYINNMNMAKKYGYEYANVYPAMIRCNRLGYGICLEKKYIWMDKSDMKNYEKSIMRNHKGDDFFGVAVVLAKISLVFAFPHNLKPRISAIVGGNRFSEKYYREKLVEYAALKNLSDFLYVDESYKGTFKFIRNLVPHSPWRYNKKCEVVVKQIRGYAGYYQGSYCAIQKLGDFFQKLKDRGIYDKTKIIVVSDHGNSSHPLVSIDSKKYDTKINAAHALLLVKDFYSRGALKESMQFMSNYDAYGIALSGVSQGIETELDPIMNPPVDRVLAFVRKIRYNYPTEMYEVKKSVFDEKNWIRVK